MRRVFLTNRRIFLALALCSLFLAGQARANPPENKRHVVVVVWDGMRPDFVSEKYTPTLWKLSREGVVFQNHHSIYPTSTEVNGTAIATGEFPGHSGLLANREFRPAIDATQAVDTAEAAVLQKGDELTGGKYLARPTIAEILRAAGRRAVIAGSKSVVLLQDRSADWTNAKASNGLTKFAAAPMPADLRAETQKELGQFLTDNANTNAQRNTYTTRALTEMLWRDGLPPFSLVWLSEPDLTQHEKSPGAPESIAAIKSCDDDLGILLKALERERDTTDIFLVSDHGFSTIQRAIDFPAALNQAGFHAFTTFTETPKPGDIMVVGNGGSVLFYVTNHDRDVTQRLVDWLQHSDFAGVIFTREKTEGAFPLSEVHDDAPDAPDVEVALRWNSNVNRFGVPGEITTDSGRRAGNGSHASFSKFDVHNTLIAVGPDFARGMTDKLPTSNIDLAPTILHILGVSAPGKFDGRILNEAMNVRESASAKPVERTDQAARDLPTGGRWHQYLRVSTYEGETYFDEGNGSFSASGNSR